MQNHICKVCLAITCHLRFWQNDRDLLRATVVTRGWNGYRNKSQHRKSALEKKILPPLLQGFKPTTFQSWVQCSNHWTIPTPIHSYYLCPTLQLRMEAGESKITNTESILRRVRRIVSIVSNSKAVLRSRRVRMEIESGSSSKEVIENMKESCLNTMLWTISWLEGVTKIVLIQITKKLPQRTDLKGLKFLSTLREVFFPL